MEMKGDIHVWIENGAAHATLTFEGEEGQVTISAETSLAAARQYVRQLLARRGEDFSGLGEERLGQLTDQMGRSRALRLLRTMAPTAFIPGGHVTLAVARRLRGKRRRPAAPPRGTHPGPAPVETLPPGPEPDDDQDDARDDDATASDETTRGSTGPAEADVGAPAVPAAALAATPQLAAGAALISAARSNPKAARRIRDIFRRARAGNPQAQKSARVLVAAKKAEQDQQNAMRALVRRGTEPPPVTGPLPPTFRGPSPPLPALPAEASLPSPHLVLPPPHRRASGIFETWRRGIV